MSIIPIRVSATFGRVLPLMIAVLFSPLSPALHSLAPAQQAENQPRQVSGPRRALNLEDTYSWKNVVDETLSYDGRWLAYSVLRWEGDGEGVVRELSTSKDYRIPRGKGLRFSADSRFLVCLIAPPKGAVDAATREKKTGTALPVESLGIVDLAKPEVVFEVPRVSSFKLPRERGDLVAYLSNDIAKEEVVSRPSNPPPDSSANIGKPKEQGKPLVLRNLGSGTEVRFAGVTAYDFSQNGDYLIYTASDKTGSLDGAFAVQISNGQVTPLLKGEGVYKQLTLDQTGNQVAFLSNRDSWRSNQPTYSLYYARLGNGEAQAKAREGALGIPKGWSVSEYSSVVFSENGERIFFGTAPMPMSSREEKQAPDEKIAVDVWNWQDPYLQPRQALQRERENRRSYQAVLFLGDNRIVQLANEDVPDVTVGAQGNADVALGSSRLPYRQLTSWDGLYQDHYLIDVQSGNRTRVIQKLRRIYFGEVSLSLGGRYLCWWDGVARAWYVMSVKDRKPINVSAAIPYPVYDIRDDHPDQPPPVTRPMWIVGDEGLVIYDAEDIWLVDPAGRKLPRNLTQGLGRREGIRFRYAPVRVFGSSDPFGEKTPVSLDREVLLAAFDEHTKASGYYRTRFSDSKPPTKLIMEDARLPSASGVGPERARNGKQFVFRKESFSQSSDLWTSDLNFDGLKQVTNANPQQANFTWGREELITWPAMYGQPLQGILIKPDPFEPGRKYPLIVYFYEHESDDLHRYRAPYPDPSCNVSPSFYVSRGYMVFIPDIRYRIGHPGPSARDAIVSGVQALVNKGFVDPARIGGQGHSWGGYQIVYLITQTNLFAAAAAGAPVSNMISAYGGISWESGESRMYKYEREQSRIGASLWESPQLFIENSPIFYADKIHTPLLMLSNDHDGTVPWYQGIELFVSLRRLHKPAWLVNYNGQDHWLSGTARQKDWARRMQQFFDHYLLGESAPAWLGTKNAQDGRSS